MKAKLIIPFFILLAACTANKQITDEQKTAVQEEGSAVVKEMFDALAVSDAGKMISLCENSADFTFILAGEVYDYNSMMTMIQDMLPLVEKQTFDTKLERYIVVDQSCFIYYWHGRNSVYMKSGEATVEEDYLASYGFRKNADGWKLFTGHESARPAAPVDTSAVQ